MVRVIIGCTIRNLSVLNQAKLKLCTCSKCDSSLVPYATYRDHQNKAKRDRSRAAYNSIHTPPDLLPESNVSNPMGENDTHNPPRALPQTDDGDNDVINIPPDDLEVSGDEMDRITISQRYDSIQNLADDGTLLLMKIQSIHTPLLSIPASVSPLSSLFVIPPASRSASQNCHPRRVHQILSNKPRHGRTQHRWKMSTRSHLFAFSTSLSHGFIPSSMSLSERLLQFLVWSITSLSPLGP